MQTLLAFVAAMLLASPGSGVGSLGLAYRVQVNLAVRDAIQRAIPPGVSGEANLERIPPQNLPVPKK